MIPFKATDAGGDIHVLFLWHSAEHHGQCVNTSLAHSTAELVSNLHLAGSNIRPVGI